MEILGHAPLGRVRAVTAWTAPRSSWRWWWPPWARMDGRGWRPQDRVEAHRGGCLRVRRCARWGRLAGRRQTGALSASNSTQLAFSAAHSGLPCALPHACLRCLPGCRPQGAADQSDRATRETSHTSWLWLVGVRSGEWRSRAREAGQRSGGKKASW